MLGLVVIILITRIYCIAVRTVMFAVTLSIYLSIYVPKISVLSLQLSLQCFSAPPHNVPIKILDNQNKRLITLMIIPCKQVKSVYSHE